MFMFVTRGVVFFSACACVSCVCVCVSCVCVCRVCVLLNIICSSLVFVGLFLFIFYLICILLFSFFFFRLGFVSGDKFKLNVLQLKTPETC